MKTELTTMNDNRKSFYNKAQMEIEDNANIRLYSYNTLVAEIKNGQAVIYNLQSATTVRHVKEFLLQNGFEAGTKKELIKKYGIEEIKLS